MNKILNLLEVDYVKKYFNKHILPLYPEFDKIESIKIKPFKKMIWSTTYHVVISYDTVFIDKMGRRESRLIVCTAHKEEGRRNVFLSLKYLWDKKLNQDEKIDLPTPLFYSQYYHGAFYQGLEGENLLHYIKINDRQTVKNLVNLSAKLFARLHELPANQEANFSPLNARIKTVIPGVSVIKKEMSRRYQGKFDDDIAKIYDIFVKQETKNLNKNFKLNLIHGDAHTENIINTGRDRVGLIDFTDICLGDFARDLGTFLQQLEYKIVIKAQDLAWAEEMKNLFVKTYLKERQINLDDNLKNRINLYYNWTMMRTAVFLFMKHDSNPVKGEKLLFKIKKNLNI